MHVLLISQWTVNPYQKLLVAHLQKLGVDVSEESLTIRRLIFQGCPHILHLQNVRPWLTSGGTMVSLVRAAHFAVRLVVARALGIRIVWTAHDLESPSKRHRIIDRLVTATIARLAHGTIVHSESSRVKLAVAAWLKTTKVHVIPHGNYIGYYPDAITRGNARAILEIGDHEIVFLLFGWIKRYKRVVELIRAFKSLSIENARLVIAGKAPEREFENEIRTEAAGDPRILLHLRSIAESEVQVYFNASDVAVFPYVPVLTSGAIVLARSFGKACLAPKDSGVEDPANGTGTFFYDPDAEVDLARALQIAIHSRDRLAQMGTCNRANAERQDWENVAALTTQLYTTIL
jgi:glycosyltransferase involved in cell wall biosynthesis